MATTKRCLNCGNEFTPKEEWHKYCSPKCRNEASGESAPGQSGGRLPPGVDPNFRLDENYLRDGYFLDPERKELNPEIVRGLARNVAWVLVKADTKPYQLRRFFNQLRALQRSKSEFEEIRSEIAKLDSAAVRQVGRNLVGEDFKRFIERNVELSLENEANFLGGFIPHFAAVLGYFEYVEKFRPRRS